ncbi:uncharacterized protein CEXT_476701 [Caerostris extrusa]|uniref:Uncharacterized protein n=1 Tax=Caerostris extrusa TaxID=172846 RepID=A0AAV4VJZ9_CAEEX|nr:uncharacterized protein CEXT_476701 [Caerostris extrusa]
MSSFLSAAFQLQNTEDAVFLLTGYEEAGPSFRSAQNFNVNAFTRALNQGMGGYKAPSYRNNRYLPQASFVVPTAYALRHVGFGLGGF